MINDINKNLIKELRRRTGISLIKCKQALVKSNGNIDLAIDSIRNLGLKIDLNKSKRSTLSGSVASKITFDHKIGLIIEVNCETDFVVKNIIFQKFIEIVMNIALDESIDDIDILRNRVKQQRSILINKVGENIKINNFAVLRGSFVSSYIHGSRIGVIISVSGKIHKNIIKYIAMHIAARNPKYIYIDDIPESVMIRERHIQTNIAMQSGKSQKIVEQIVIGRMDNFFNECVLLKQDFIMDTNSSVGDILEKYCIKINSFIRFEIGK